ncbi:hypothetical protein FLP10_15120 [Agromyces intestinalis]|uniref:Uncharacterized protein n=1 Tax=Agromyces intestinalis TaxID=2592652 RepID=A0A5C1YK23_9MICO|nr:hypothetical protein [Agromyces intestinalis]QEO15610.1 hypothetical protein FLP10_15120 [Agromyces intestinalis]
MTMSINIDLPKYPANLGPAAAKRLEKQRAKYRERAEELRDALSDADEQFAIALASLDRQQSTRDRISQLARTATRR